MLLLDGDIREDNLVIIQTQLLGSNVSICLTKLKKLENLRNFVGKFILFKSQYPHDDAVLGTLKRMLTHIFRVPGSIL